MTGQDWSASLYSRFEAERTRPVRDLLAAVPAIDVRRAVDLGCGPGNSTQVLAERFPGAEIVGVDSSPDMVAAAGRRLPGVHFELGDIAGWRGDGAFDLILSNAALHWVGNHESLFPRLATALSPGGTLAVQMPDNLDDEAQTLMQRIARSGPWAQLLARAGAARTAIGDAGFYYDLLRPLCARVDIWSTTYLHSLAGAAGIVDWFRSTGLRPFLDPLNAEEQAAYLRRYEAAVAACFAVRIDGTVLLRMRRLFIVAAT